MKRALHTALLAVLILAIGISVLYGVRAFLPDYTEELREHSMTQGQFLPLFEQQKELILYPWTELTENEPVYADSETEWLFWELSGMLGWSFSQIDLGKAEFCFSKDGNIGGVRNVTAYTAQVEDYDADAELITSVSTATLSVAFDSDKETFSWFCAEFPFEEASDTSIRRGYETLCADSQALLAAFAKQYENACMYLGLFGGIDAVNSMLSADEPACELYGGRAYIRYTSQDGCLTLVCDPLTQTVAGFSLETA